jgi:ureidoglycolate lyase
VIQTNEAIAQEINHGRTLKYADLARVESNENGGETTISIYRSQPVELPFLIERLERHPLGSQAFMPLHRHPFPVIVAPPGDELDAGSIRGFISNGEQGVNFRPGVWHHYQLSFDKVSDYLVIDRSGPGGNCDEWLLRQPLLLD